MGRVAGKDPGARVRGGLPEARLPIRERLSQRAESVARDGLAGLGPTASAANFSSLTLARQPELAGLFERLFELQDAATYGRCCRILVSASATSVVPSVRVPCLSVTGSDDQYAPPELVSAFMRQLPGACSEVVVQDCGHLPFLEAPEAFAEAVRSFVERLC